MEDVGEETAECSEGRVRHRSQKTIETSVMKTICRVFTKLSTKTKPKLKAKINSKRSRT